MKINERFIWAADLLNVKASDSVLEIGCGAGVLVEQIAKKLSSGSITGVDKSSPMIKLASTRNAGFISKGTVNLITGEFSGATFKKSQFDKVVAFNVNFFWKDPQKELEIIRQCLKPGGKLFIFYQAPYEITIKAAEPIKSKLQTQSFEVIDVILKKLVPASAFCILAKPG